MFDVVIDCRAAIAYMLKHTNPSQIGNIYIVYSDDDIKLTVNSDTISYIKKCKYIHATCKRKHISAWLGGNLTGRSENIPTMLRPFMQSEDNLTILTNEPRRFDAEHFGYEDVQVIDITKPVPKQEEEDPYSSTDEDSS